MKSLRWAGAGCALAFSALLVGCGAQPAASSDSDASGDAAQSAQEAPSDGVARKGDTVKVNYTGTLEDGTKFDSSYDRGTPLEFTVGSGQMISGFDAAVEGMKVGEKKTVTLAPDQAYGEPQENLVISMPTSDVPGSEDLKVGDSVVLTTSDGRQVKAKVTSVDGDKITFDANHELAGKTLTFDIELVSVE